MENLVLDRMIILLLPFSLLFFMVYRIYVPRCMAGTFAFSPFQYPLKNLCSATDYIIHEHKFGVKKAFENFVIANMCLILLAMHVIIGCVREFSLLDLYREIIA